MKSKHGYPANPGLWIMKGVPDGWLYYQNVLEGCLFGEGWSVDSVDETILIAIEEEDNFWSFQWNPWEPEESEWSLEYQLMPTQLMQWSDK